MTATATTQVARPTRGRDIPRTTWILARAFAAKSWIGRQLRSHRVAQLHALAIAPFFLLIVISCTVERDLYLDTTRTGVVVLKPQYSLRSAMGWAATFTLLVVVSLPLSLIAAITPGATLELVVATVAAVCIALLVDVTAAPRYPGPVRDRLRQQRRKVPKGERWDLMMLAQLPDTKRTAAPLAHRLLRTVVPPGAAVVVAARTAELHSKYSRYGFTPTRGKQLFCVAPDDLRKIAAIGRDAAG